MVLNESAHCFKKRYLSRGIKEIYYRLLISHENIKSRERKLKQSTALVSQSMKNLESFFLKDRVCNLLPKKSLVYLVALKLIKE